MPTSLDDLFCLLTHAVCVQPGYMGHFLVSSCLCIRYSLILECPCSSSSPGKVLQASSSAFSTSPETFQCIFHVHQYLLPQETSLPERPLSMGLPLSLVDLDSLNPEPRESLQFAFGSHCSWNSVGPQLVLLYE